MPTSKFITDPLWLSSMFRECRPLVATYDADAQTYFDRDANIAPTAPEKLAVSNWIAAGKANGWWTPIYDAGLMCWANATANAKRIKSASTITFAGGTTTHNANSIAFSSNGYADLGITAANASQTTASCSFGANILGALSDVGGADMGPFDATGTQQSLFVTNFAGNYADIGNESTARVSGGVTGDGGLFIANRYTTGNAELVHYDEDGQTVLGSRADASGGNMSTRAFYLGARNNVGSPSLYTNRTYSLWFIGTAMTTAERALFLSDTWTMLIALGAT